jgi:TctA family transporter
MAKQGRAGPALAIAAIGSFFAGCVATVLIAVLGAPLTRLALAFGPAEYFSLMVLGLIFAVVLAKGSVLKAIAMIVLGLLLSMVGSDIEPAPRAWPSTFRNWPTASASRRSRWACSALPRSSATSTPAWK